ncbi:hypothetical protein GGR57DRAFT_205791 [Xylariaceae sp. FL1272]|nr:hypothetical protein GGR57DRAFT_205791 [Xylariaceae sp. FL1272]
MASRVATRCISLIPPARRHVALQRWSRPRPAPCLAPPTLVPASRRFAHNIPKPPRPATTTAQPNADDAAASPDAATSSDAIPRKQLEPHYQLTFTCVPCGDRSSHTVSKQGYHKGSVLITCPQCRNRHVISDHLNIFGDRHLTVEDLMREKGQLVKRGTLGEDGDIEFWQDDIAPSLSNNNTTPVHPSATAPSTRRQFSTISSSRRQSKPQVYTDRSPRITPVDPKFENSNAESLRHEAPTATRPHLPSVDQPLLNTPQQAQASSDHGEFVDLELSRKINQLNFAHRQSKIVKPPRIYFPSKRVSHEEMLHSQIQKLNDMRLTRRLQEREARNKKIQEKRERRRIQQEAERRKLDAATTTTPNEIFSGQQRKTSNARFVDVVKNGTSATFAAAATVPIQNSSEQRKESSGYEAFFRAEEPAETPSGRIAPRQFMNHKHVLSADHSSRLLPHRRTPMTPTMPNPPKTAINSPRQRKLKLKRGVLEKHGRGYESKSKTSLVRKFFSKPANGLLNAHEAEREARLQMARSRLSSTVRKVYNADLPSFDARRALASSPQAMKNKPHPVRDREHVISEKVRRVANASEFAFKKVYDQNPPQRYQHSERRFYPPGDLMGIQPDLTAGFSTTKAKAVEAIPKRTCEHEGLPAKNPTVLNFSPELQPVNRTLDKANVKANKETSRDNLKRRLDTLDALPNAPRRFVRIGDEA